MKTVYGDVSQVVEASYKDGFSQGYDAALVALSAILSGVTDNTDFTQSVMEGMKKAKEGAYMFMGCPPEVQRLSASLNGSEATH